VRAKVLLISAFLFGVVQGCFSTVATADGVQAFDLSIQTKDSLIRCRVDTKPVDVKLSSDGEAVIVSGTGYIPMSALSGRRPENIIHVKTAAPHVGFLSDVNLKAGIYASMVPVSVSPLSYVAVVAKLGSDSNLIKRSGFYRKGVSESKLEEEASSSMNPVISLDGRYLSVEVMQCGTDEGIDIFEIKTGRTLTINSQSCNRMFNFR
jgi:hypothetical protein